MCSFDDINYHFTSFSEIMREKLGPQKSLFYLRGPQKGPKKGFLRLFGDVPPHSLKILGISRIFSSRESYLLPFFYAFNEECDKNKRAHRVQRLRKHRFLPGSFVKI